MIRMVLAIAAATAALFWELPSSQALVGDAPWCAVINVGTGDMQWDCQYMTAAQCAPNVVAGNRGFCNVNPYFTPSQAGPPMPMRHHARQRPHKHPHAS